jgi:hypothetical protein
MGQKRRGGKDKSRVYDRTSKKRDYRGEYAARIARAKRLGYDLSVARGHPKAGTLAIRVAKSLKLPPGTRISDLQLKTTGREVDQGTIDREFQALARMGFNIAQLNKLDFSNEDAFIKYLLDNGFTMREAYQLRFSP